jgi:PAS domain S-box-containing protein
MMDIFKAVAETISDAMVVIDVDGRILFWNPAAEKLFGRTSGEMVGQSLQRIMPERHWKSHQTALARLRAGAAPRLMGKELHLEALDPSGTEFPIVLALLPWSDAEHPGPGDWSYVGIVRKDQRKPGP